MKRIYRITAWVVLLTFGFQVCGGNLYAQVLSNDRGQTTEDRRQTSAEEWEKAILSLEESLSETKTKTFSANVLSKKQDELLKINQKLEKEFKETEEFLKQKKLPDKILQRHYDFVKQYNENYKKLKENLDSSIKTKDTRVLKEFLEKAQYKEKPRPLDPNKLPHRLAPQIKPKEPRTKEAVSRKLSAVSTEDYLKETIDVQITDEIKRLATETLKSNPVLIYEYVRNNFDYEPYYGSLKGSQQTLWEKAGNDFDLASLLIALYRAANIPARYVYGTIEIPIEKAMNWVGVKDSQVAANLLAGNGIPTKIIVYGSGVKKIRIEHCWVEAYVTYDQYRGARQSASYKIWLPLDPSFKEYSYIEGIELGSLVPFDGESFVKEIEGSSTINESEGYVQNIPYNIIQQRMDEYKTNVDNYLKAHPEITIDSLMGTKTIKAHKLGIFPLSLPYKTILTQSRYSEISPSLRHKIQFSVSDGINYTASLPELVGKRITLSYIPSTPNDEAIINSYLPKPHPDGSPIQPDEFPTNLPAYLINLKPELRVEGTIKATGNEIQMGQDQTFTMDFIDPRGTSDRITNDIIAGEFYAIGLDIGRISTEIIQKRQERVKAIKDLLETKQTEELTKDDLIGEFLYTTAIGYFYQLDTFNKVIANKLNIRNLRLPSEAITSFGLNISYLWSTPISASFSGIAIDVDRDIEVVLSKTQDKTKEKNYVILSGMIGSGLEHGVLEQIFSTKEKPAYGISAVKALKVANDLGIPIYTINKDNISDILPNLQVSQAVKADIQNSVNARKVVTISKTEITYAGWAGVGYIVMDPETGAAGYLITGGMAGGTLVMSIGLAFILIALILSPYAFQLGFQLLMEGILFLWTGFLMWIETLPKEKRELVFHIAEIIETVAYMMDALITCTFPMLGIAIACLLYIAYEFCEWFIEYTEKKPEKTENKLFYQKRRFA
ncbi:MAG: transglutaminase-like domain-containing protein [bacterium]